MTNPSGWNPTGAYNFFPTTGELVSAAYARIQIRRSEILQEHMQNAANECNLLQVNWANLGPLLWTVDLVTQTLDGTTQTFAVDPSTVMILDAYVSTNNNSASYSDRIIMPLSRTEWASTPDKTQPGSPTSFWFDRLYPSPTITLWPFPDGTSETSFSYYRFRNIQDAAFGGASTPQVPYLWLDAWVAGLAHRLSRIYKPELEQQRGSDAAGAYEAASMQGVENTALFIAPATAPYYR